MKISPHFRNRGIAIVIVMVSIFVLAALAAAFAYAMKVETRLAYYGHSESEMEWIGRGGVEHARWVLGNELVLSQTGQHMDSLGQRWAHGSDDTNEILMEAALDDIPIGRGWARHVTIVDTERKFNINTALYNQPVLQQALILIGADASEIPGIISSIQDWIDRDEDIHLNGAESQYYQNLDPPYACKNGPLDNLSELLLVKGITPDLYWGPNSPNHPVDVFAARRRQSGPQTAFKSSVPVGMVDLFTTVSSGYININTASSTTFQMLGMEADAADRLVGMREMKPFDNTGEIINALPNQALAQQMMRYLTVRSTTFEVTVDAELGPMKRRYYALLRRNSARDVQILNMHWE